MKTAGEQFSNLSERYIKALFDFWPNQGTWAGLHEYDSSQPDLRGERITARLDEVQAFQAELTAIDDRQLSPEEEFDYRLLNSALESEIYQWSEEKDYVRNPMWYLRGLEVMNFIRRDYAPIDDRMRGVLGYLQNTPRLLDAARANLMPNPPRPFIKIALEAYEGMLAFYDKDLVNAAKNINSQALQEEVDAARQSARAAVAGFVADLRDRYLPKASEDYAIGAERFERMLQSGELVELPLHSILAVGERDLNRNLHAAREVAKQIDTRLSPAEVAKQISKDHPSAEDLIPATRSLLEDIRAFLIDRKVVSVPSEVRARVEETPAFLRWAFAMMDTPGPFEKVANEAYYYITPPDPHWTAEQQEEWLSSFNWYGLKDVSVHEAYPGHYVHYLHVNHNVHGRLRQLLYSYAFSEGWAHYTEEMMLDAGYGGEDAKLRFAQLQEALTRNCRYICAIKLHTQGMTVDEATRFFMVNAFMEETPARKEAERGTFDPGYLNYTLGKLMILKLREDFETRQGTRFNLREFHDLLLSYGAPPVPLAREAILGKGDHAIL